MKELILMRDKNAVTSSLIVAEVFGKEHRNVLRDIEGVLKSTFTNQHMFMSRTNKNILYSSWIATASLY